jgi:hypothetical protein
VGYTTDRELHPAPKVFIWLSRLYPAGHNLCPRVFYASVRFNDAIDRADTDALGGIEVTFTFHAGGLIDDVQNAIAFTDGLSRAFGYTCATGDAVFKNFHCHGRYSFKDLRAQV